MTEAATFWNSIAEKYAKQPIANVPAWERKKQETKDRLSPGDRVLEVGCGTGSLALELAPHVAEVHGVDISPEMVRIARGKIEAAGADNVTFYAEPFEDIDGFEDESFDMVCAYSILHLVPDRHDALRAMHRLLKPGGWLVTSTVCLRESLMPFGAIIAVMRVFGKAPRVTQLGREELCRDIEAAGFGQLEQPDVGTKKTVAFVIARKPLG